MRRTLDARGREIHQRFAGLALPRHTSYPAANLWSEAYTHADYVKALGRLREAAKPISLYVHVPFCASLCHYCACTKLIVAKDDARSTEFRRTYLEAVKREIEGVVRESGCLSVRHLHFGGGTPTYLDPEQILDLVGFIRGQLDVQPDAELAIELDPRATGEGHLRALADAGFNRLSLGVQDFDPRVQEAINRVQPPDLVERFVALCREAGLGAINFDLIYGLPFQSVESVGRTLDQVLALRPDRVALYRLAMIPELFKWQRLFGRADLPDAEAALEMFLLALERFEAAGYRHVGLDHFALPTDALARAEADGTLRRTFQGMTTGGDVDVVGVGPSAISFVGGEFAQNEPDFYRWAKRVDVPTVRGHALTDDDRRRSELLTDLYCNRRIDKGAFEARTATAFDSYFVDALPKLEGLRRAGLLEATAKGWRLTDPLGRLLVRVVAAVFDAYLPADAYLHGVDGRSASRVG